MLIDSHCHLTDAQFADDLDAVLARSNTADVVAMVCAGADVESSRAAVRLAEQSASVYAVVGIHPEHAASFSADAMRVIPAVLALGLRSAAQSSKRMVAQSWRCSGPAAARALKSSYPPATPPDDDRAVPHFDSRGRRVDSQRLTDAA